MQPLTPLFAAVLSLPAAAWQQPPAPPIQNAKVETRQATQIDRELSALGAGPDAVWVAWRVPMVDGDRASCSTWTTNGTLMYRGEVLEPGARANTPPPAGATSVSLEAGTGLIVLARMLDGRVERLRSVDDSCPIDANGRTVYWLNGITPAESLRYLDSLTRQDALNIDTRRRLAESALGAVALHRDAGADAILDRLASAPDSGLRSQATSQLASLRGAHGFATIRRLFDAERDRATRRSLASALAQTRQPATAEALLAIARADADADVRATAVHGYAVRAGQAGVANVLAIIDKETSDTVRQRAVSGLGRLPADIAVPALIDLARGNATPVVKKQAVQALGQFKDQRAVAFLESLLK